MRTIVTIVATLSVAALSTPSLADGVACTTSACEKRVHVKDAQACETKACLARACRSSTCRARVAQKRWRRLQAALPSSMKDTLARLRGCETHGIPFPENYQLGRGDPRWNGHDGAYQYKPATWARAGGTGTADRASPAEQDVRTARFWPSHRGEWSCKV